MDRVSTSMNPVLPSSLQPTPNRDADPATIGKTFESMLMSLLLSKMRQTLDGGLFSGDKSDVLGGLFDHFIGQHIAQSGGVGIGNMIRMQLERRPERTPTA